MKKRIHELEEEDKKKEERKGTLDLQNQIVTASQDDFTCMKTNMY